MQEDLIFSIAGGIQSDENGRQIFTLGGSKLYSDTGELVTTKNYSADQTLNIKATVIGEETVEATKTVILKKRTFPTSVNIEGEAFLAGTGSLNFDLSYVGEYDAGVVSTSWNLTPETTVAQLSNKTHLGCDLLVNVASDTSLTLAVTVTFENNTVREDSVPIELKLKVPVAIMTSATNAPVLAICYAKGWCASPDSMTDLEASRVTNIGEAFTRYGANTDIKSFDEFQYFTGVTGLTNRAFSYNRGMTSIILPDGVTSLGFECFSYCASLTSITLGDSVRSLGSSCFYGCTALTSITLPDSIVTVSNGCFSGCIALTSITIPDGVTSIGDNCFFGCTALTSVTLGNSVTSIGDYCFAGCSAITSIYSLRSTAPGGSEPFSKYSQNYTGRNTYNQGVNMLYVPQGATGYNAGYWLTTLQNAKKCGFTISYTL